MHNLRARSKREGNLCYICMTQYNRHDTGTFTREFYVDSRGRLFGNSMWIPFIGRGAILNHNNATSLSRSLGIVCETARYCTPVTTVRRFPVAASASRFAAVHSPIESNVAQNPLIFHSFPTQKRIKLRRERKSKMFLGAEKIPPKYIWRKKTPLPGSNWQCYLEAYLNPN